MNVAIMIGRAGSKGYPKKNTLNIFGKKLCEYPLIATKKSKIIDRIYVSTDCSKIKKASKKYKVSLIDRPKRLSTDKALGDNVFEHAYQEIKKIEIKDKPKVKNIENEKNINIKENVQIKEKKTIPNEIIKKKIELETSNFESLPTEKIKPKLKPKIEPKIMENNTKTDVSIEAKPKPKPEPEFDIASMLKDLRNEKTTPKVDNINEEEKKDIIKKETQEVVEEKGAELSISEIDLVLQQLSRCFIAPAGAEINKSMYVKISAKIQRNRRVLENSIRIVDTNISKSSTVYGPITESAMRTLLNPDCIPLKLPEDKYELWKNLTMKFDYSIMRGN